MPVKVILPQQSKKCMTFAVTDYDNAGELPDNADALLDTIERLPDSELKYISKELNLMKILLSKFSTKVQIRKRIKVHGKYLVLC